jgi:hypothetical protein
VREWATEQRSAHLVDHDPVLAAALVQPRGGAEPRGPRAYNQDGYLGAGQVREAAREAQSSAHRGWERHVETGVASDWRTKTRKEQKAT